MLLKLCTSTGAGFGNSTSTGVGDGTGTCTGTDVVTVTRTNGVVCTEPAHVSNKVARGPFTVYT